MQRILSWIALAVLCSSGNLWADDAAKKDQEKLQGTWQAAALTFQGQEVPEDRVKGMKFVFKGDEYIELRDGEEIEKGKFKLDPTKSPRTMDLDILTGQSQGEKQPCLYEFDGEKLTMCLALPGVEKRPAKLESTADNGAILLVLKKVK
jgi:uncharacterized protein (TIGR03067 family)